MFLSLLAAPFTIGGHSKRPHMLPASRSIVRAGWGLGKWEGDEGVGASEELPAICYPQG